MTSVITPNIQKLLLLRNNACIMLKQRGYCLDNAEFGDNYIRIPEVFVIFVPGGKLKISRLKNILSLRIADEKIIIIHENTITSEARNVITSTQNIETFTYYEMGFDFCSVVPPHTKVEKHNHKDWKLYPKLAQSEIACTYFGFEKDDIIKVVEDDNTISYRRVV